MVSMNDINQHISAVMETMGWPEDAFMPIANDANRQLMKSIEQEMEAKKMKTEHRDQLRGRVKMLNDHFESAQVGVIQNLVRSTAHFWNWKYRFNKNYFEETT